MTEARLKFLQENKQRGDVAEVVKRLNPKNSPKGITLTEAYSIINGNLRGKWMNAFANELEKIIRDRNRRMEREKRKYSKVA